MYRKNSNLKVAFIVGEFPLTTETFIMDQITGLIDMGMEIKIIAIRKSDEVVSSKFQEYSLENRTVYLNIPRSKKKRFVEAIKLISSNISKHPVAILRSLNFFKFGKVAFSLIPLFMALKFIKSKENFDIIHSHFGQRGLYGAILKDVGIRAKYATSFYGGDLSSFVEQTNKNVYLPLFESGDIFLPLSLKFKERLIALGCPENKISVLPLGIDTSKFKLIKRPGRKEITFLTVGRLVEKKGHRYALEAIAKISKKINARYIIAGDGPMRPFLESLAKKLDIEQNVEFLGAVNPDIIPKLYEKSDIFILPSHVSLQGDTEGTPMVLMEAQATGLPVISTIHSSIPEVVQDSKTGFLVAEKDVQSLAEKSEYLSKNKKLREKMGENGRKFILLNYDKRILISRLSDIYSSLLSGKTSAKIY